MIYALLFEAKSIQSFLFESGRLRDVIGASELVDSLTGTLLEKALATLDIAEERDIRFSRRAGGAFYAFGEDVSAIERLTALWTLLVQQYAPGMAYDLGRGSGETALAAFDAARGVMRSDASRHRPRLPNATPLVERSRRTGLAAEDTDSDGPLDAATRRKNRLADSRSVEFIERFSPPDAELAWRDWPTNLEPGEEGAFPFLPDSRTIALVHADGNSLGQLLMNARKAASSQPAQFIKLFRHLSDGIAAVTREAAQTATKTVLLAARDGDGPVPARPVLLGGDDLTILVRADLALPFLRIFAETFETGSRNVMKGLQEFGVADLPEKLSVGAGVVYMRASQPFYLATELAESLIEHAKGRAKAARSGYTPSSFAFHRVTSALTDDYGSIVERELSHRERDTSTSGEERTYTSTLGAYALVENCELPHVVHLVALQKTLQAPEMARGPSRQLLTLLGLSPPQARTHYRRWRQLMQENKKPQLKVFDQIMTQIVASYSEHSELPFGKCGETYVSPLSDVLALMAVGNVPAELGVHAGCVEERA